MRHIRYSGLLVLGLAALLGAVPAGAQGLDQAIRINGFVSQGYLNTDGVDYLVPNSQDGSANFSEVAVTVTATPTDKLRIAAQFLARSFGESSEVTLDWGYGDYHWRDALGVRAGKVKLPYGLFNEVRDLDFLRTTVFMPQSVYEEGYRELLQAYSGVGFYGNLNLNGGGDLDYHLYGGTLNVSNATEGYWNDSYSELAGTLEPFAEAYAEAEFAPGTAEATLVGVLDPTVTFPYMYGGSLIWDTPLDPLKVGSTILTGRFNYSATFRYDVTMTEPGMPVRYYPVNFEFDDGNDVHHILTFSAEFVHDDLQVAGEYVESSIDESITEGWYALADYRLLEPLSVAAVYSVYYDDKENRDGNNLEVLGFPSYYAWQKDWTLAASYNLTDRWLIKAEYHWMNGVALAQPQGQFDPQADPLPQYWHMFAAKTTFHF